MNRRPRAAQGRPAITLVHLQGPAPVISPPLGCLCLLAALERAGIGAEFRDYQLWEGPAFDPQGLVAFMADDSADIIGVSAMTNVLPHLIHTLRVMSESFPEKRVILGGPGPASVARALMASYPVAAAVVLGEGEEALPAVVRAMHAGADLTGIPGLVLPAAQGVRVTTQRPRIADLDRLPPPAFHRVDLSRYNGAMPLELARGCPFSCSFCETSAFWGREVRHVPPEHVVDTALAVAAQADRHDFGFVDDTFGVDDQVSGRLLDLLEGSGVRWTCSTRVERLDEASVSRMAAAGCHGVFLGIESGSELVLRRIKKRGVSVEQIATRAALLQDRFDSITASFIWGFPFESPEDLIDSLALATTLRGLGAVTPMHLLSALPSSPLTGEFAGLRRFDPGLVPDLSVAPLSDAAVDLIRENVDVFSSFYYFDHPTLSLKRSLVRRHGRPRVQACGVSEPRASEATG